MEGYEEKVINRVVFRFKRSVIFLLILLVTLFLLNPSVYAEWTVVPPPYVSSDWDLYGIHFTSLNEGWAVGYDYLSDSGVLLHYLNGCWTSVTSPIQSSLSFNGVHFTSSSEGWAVGYGPNNTGALLHYLNGSWELLSPPNVGPPGYIYWELNDVHFTSPKEGWAVGGVWIGNNPMALLLHYINGSWVQDNSLNFIPGEGSPLLGVHFISPKEGWAVGEDFKALRGILLHYSDGSWTSIAPPYVSSNWGLYDVYFHSSNEGWAVGADHQGGLLLHYFNGSWTPIPPPYVNSAGGWWLNNVHFSSTNEGWASGVNHQPGKNEGVLLHYMNGIWTTAELPPFAQPPFPSQGWELYGVYFPSSDQGWAVGSLDYSPDDYHEKLFSGVVLNFSTPEIVSLPTTLRGSTYGIIGKSYKYTTGGSTSNLSHTVEYQFDWKGDGSDLSNWGSQTQSKIWIIAGVYKVRARARCTQDTSVISDWSSPLLVSIGVPDISVIPTAFDFGNVKMKRNKTVSFRIKNNGKGDLSITSSIVGLDASMFTIKTGGGSKTIKPGRTLTIRVGFKPTSTGSKTSVLRITSNDPDTPTIDIPLSGEGQ